MVNVTLVFEAAEVDVDISPVTVYVILSPSSSVAFPTKLKLEPVIDVALNVSPWS